MRLKKLEDFVTLPVKVEDNEYIELRCLDRVDVRPGERLDIPTGVAAYVGKTETVTVRSDWEGKLVYSKLGKYVALFIRVKNDGDMNIMLYPGQPIASLTVEKSGPRTKKATIKTKATWKTN